MYLLPGSKLYAKKQKKETNKAIGFVLQIHRRIFSALEIARAQSSNCCLTPRLKKCVSETQQRSTVRHLPSSYLHDRGLRGRYKTNWERVFLFLLFIFTWTRNEPCGKQWGWGVASSVLQLRAVLGKLGCRSRHHAGRYIKMTYCPKATTFRDGEVDSCRKSDAFNYPGSNRFFFYLYLDKRSVFFLCHSYLTQEPK